MSNLSNSCMEKTFFDEINSILLDICAVSKKFIYKYHLILGYF